MRVFSFFGSLIRRQSYRLFRWICFDAASTSLDAIAVSKYGMTETCGTIVYQPPEDHHPEGNRRMRFAGRPMPGVELKIVGNDGNNRPADEVGEVASRSVSNMNGDWNHDALTQDMINGDGWLFTGDAGDLNEARSLYIPAHLRGRDH